MRGRAGEPVWAQMMEALKTRQQATLEGLKSGGWGRDWELLCFRKISLWLLSQPSGQEVMTALFVRRLWEWETWPWQGLAAGWEAGRGTGQGLVYRRMLEGAGEGWAVTAEGLKTETDSVPAPEARSPKLRCGQGHASFKAPSCLFLLLVAPGIPQSVVVSLNVCLSSRGLSLCLSLCPLLL